jgi:RHH-type proline utilization regulon transcriptional repressor/proline dehydrogenase/delta 1-pyrroline-5-carboxylate dehydrogenase
MAEDAARSAIEVRTQQLGRALLAQATRYRPGAAERIEDWLLTHAVTDHRFRSRLLRYMDVLASLDHDTGGREAKRLAHEYFGETFPELPRGLRWLLRMARSEQLPAPVVGESARRSAEVFARRFITPPGERTVTATIEYLAAHGRVPSFDLLGEAVLSDTEAQAYIDAYLRLIAQLSRDPAAGLRTAGGVAALQVSLKLSSLTACFTPVDPEGSIARARPGLEAIASAARAAGIGVTVDMEQYALRDLAWEVFRRAFGPGTALGGWEDAGIVLQGYLHDAPALAEAYAGFARERGTPFQVRLVKGAYWDYETIVAAANRWLPPVHTAKGATDAQFERLVERLLAASGIRLAVASHNVRAHAHAEAVAEQLGLPSGAVEHQTLFRTAEGTSRALGALGWSARDYVPVGELLPGMAYLVRRVLENSSQAGFLLQSRAGASAEELLCPPPVRPVEAVAVSAESGAFERAPAAPWHDPAFRARFEEALRSTRARWGERFGLEIAGEVLPGAREVEVRSPSYPAGAPVGTVTFADDAATERAVEDTRAGQRRWAALPVPERAAILRRAAHLIEERQHELAAWVLHEGGRDRADAFAEVEEAVDYLRYYAAEAERLFAEHSPRIAPRGVVAVIPPWNFSLAIPCGMTAAALAAGNAVILKPAEQTPLIAHRLVAALHEAGVPRDALVCLPGDGETVGAALASHPGVAMVAFTGSRAVGTALHEAVARVDLPEGQVKALVAEMGGKNPVLVFADADLDEAIEGIVRSAFGHANQKCSAASRVLVAAPVFEALRDRLVEAARSLHVGPADDPATRVNPIIDREARARLDGAAARAREEGEVLLDLFDAPRADGGPDAALLAGPLIVQLSPEQALEARTALDELFGPILVLVPFTTEEEAYRLANATPYGLTAGVYSRSPRTIERATRAIEAGTVYVNRPITGARVAIEPFGGMKFSGTGPKAGGADSLWAYMRRTDATVSGGDGEVAPLAPPPVALAALDTLRPRWEAPVEVRLAVVEGAAVRLGQSGHAAAGALFAAAQAARREIATPQPVLPVPGQHTELRYDLPRGRVLVHASGERAAHWLAAVLLAGNAALVADVDAVHETVEALLVAGAPVDVLAAMPLRAGEALGVAALAAIDCVATDVPRLARPFARALGPAPEGTRGLKVLLSPLDGPQPGEPGFARRFAWPRVVAVRTLRHGADLAIEVRADESGLSPEGATPPS